MRDGRLTMAALRDRGWTPGMIARLLGEPDGFASNPRYRNAAPMRLYDATRIEKAEATPAYAQAREEASRRSAAASKAADVRRDALMTEVRAVEVVVSRLDAAALENDAIRHYNDHLHRTGRDGEPARHDSDRGFLERITVNHVRHRLTTYDDRLEALFGRVGRDVAMDAIRARTYRAIGDAYPHLAEECERQRVDRLR